MKPTHERFEYFSSAVVVFRRQPLEPIKTLRWTADVILCFFDGFFGLKEEFYPRSHMMTTFSQFSRHFRLLKWKDESVFLCDINTWKVAPLTMFCLFNESRRDYQN